MTVVLILKHSVPGLRASAGPHHNAHANTERRSTMNLEDQLLIGGLLMAIALFSATHAHARVHPAVAHAARVTVVAPAPAVR